MANIVKVELADTFNKQRQVLNETVDLVNANLPLVAGSGITVSNGNIGIRKTGEGLTFDASGNLVGNDAYPNLITQVILSPDTAAPVPTTITTAYIDFPEFDVIFDNQVYYGKKISDFDKVHVPATRMNVATGSNGAIFVYVDSSGEIHQSLDSIDPQNSSTQCLIGSYYRLNNQIQSGSWAYTPWNGATSKDNRFAAGGSVSGGLLVAKTTTTLSRMGVSVLLEGVNVSSSVYNPNKKIYAEESSYSTKAIWPGYDASVLDSTTLDTTHIYNMTANTKDDISSKTGYIILVPGIVGPTGQDVYLMAMSPKSGNNYTQIYPTMADARAAVYGYQVSLGNVASRVLWLGQVIIAKIGATDYTDQSQLIIVGDLPNALDTYNSAASGGAGSRVSGITIKAEGSVVGEVEQKTIVNFQSGFTVMNTSGNEVAVSTSLSSATQNEVNRGAAVDKYITPSTLKGQNYLATKEFVRGLGKQSITSSWPTSTSQSDWPHTIFISTTSSYTVPTTSPAWESASILTWELVIKNTGNASISITWPSIYQPFNNETLPTTLAPYTAVFMMLRRYTNNYTLVSMQGYQSNSMI